MPLLSSDGMDYFVANWLYEWFLPDWIVQPFVDDWYVTLHPDETVQA